MSTTAPGLSGDLATTCPECHEVAPMHAPNCPLTAAQAGLKAIAPPVPVQTAQPVVSFTVDRPSTEDVLASVLSAPVPELPSQEQRIGAATILWWETDPGEVYIHAEGGTADDRHYGSTLVGLQLAPHGFRRAQFDVDEMGDQPEETPEEWWMRTHPRPDQSDPDLPVLQWDHDREAREYGMQFRHFGDAVPGGYNGSIGAYHPETGEYMGHLDYNSANNKAVIADIQVHPAHQRQGVATRLFDYARRYDPAMAWSHGYTTPEGEAWRTSLPEHLQGDIPALAPDTEHYGATRTASWVDIMEKAKRLIQSGQIQILRNGYNNVMGHVIGDHGDYDTEFSRDDPQSRSITGWQCTCPWDQYAWQRTRKWKKFEGRMCAHALGLFWQSLQTPIDHELTEEQAQGLGTGQKIGPVDDGLPPEGAPTEGPGPDSHEVKLPRSFGPEGDILQGDQLPLGEPPEATGGPPGPAQAPLAPPPGQGGPPEGAPPGGPTPPGVLPPFPGAPPEAPPWGGPGTTPGGGVSPPGAYSVPGAKPPNQPANPIQNPGTYSSVQPPTVDESIYPPGSWGMVPTHQLVPYREYTDRHEGDVAHYNALKEDIAAHGIQSPVEMYHSPQTGYSYLGDGNHRVSIAHELGISHVPATVATYGEPMTGEGWGPGRIQSTQPGFDAQGNDFVHDDNDDYVHPSRIGLGDNVPTIKTAADFNAPEVVRLKNDMMGVAEGPVPGQYGDGDGAYRDVPVGSALDVVHQDPSTGWVECTYELNDSGENEPYRVRCYVLPTDIEKTNLASDIIRRA